ncbi:phospholipid transport system substrate-binding protein [Geothermobacter ehrlichii]|uniref:Phospholipid transport system substrate-binding protein n=1 Tax=Geothermobacter ehrlichii TaxID=213224 RepID=A0A5D3WIL6_9BACT|nr:ABC transporter substrate-binding protein [Geothermobacter ehrlichii]TYO98719.1 phospholipid transport system substrate-binding protein [Geothermobacter ehrlichii]
MIARAIRIILTAVIALLLSAPTAMATTPKEDISATVNRILDVLRDKNLDRPQRRQTLTELIKGRFDFETMSRSTLGKNWRKATPEQRQRFMELFSALLEATYLGRIEAYTDETVAYGDEKIRGKKALVKTSIRSGNTDIPIHYKLVRKTDGWYVYDVVIEGVSLVRNFRGSYGHIIEREGFEKLFAKMEAKIAELKKGRQ